MILIKRNAPTPQICLRLTDSKGQLVTTAEITISVFGVIDNAKMEYLPADPQYNYRLILDKAIIASLGSEQRGVKMVVNVAGSKQVFRDILKVT